MTRERVIVVGAGMGGLAAAMRLAHADREVTLYEAAAAPGGKMRTVPSEAGPVDTGPTVLTLRAHFDDLFTDVGLRLEDYATLEEEPLLARHFWPDGSRLDLFADEAATVAEIDSLAGTDAAMAFSKFSAETRRLFSAFDAPMLRTARPRMGPLAARVLAEPALLRAMAPFSSLSRRLARTFEDRRLAQLFGRYATYVGGLPHEVPGLLALIWQAEARGIWRVAGGMSSLALALARAAERLGATLHYNAPVARIETGPAVILKDGTRHAADRVLFNGEPRALRTGRLGPDPQGAVRDAAIAPRSLSAEVWAFAATPRGPELAHHNVFFGADPATEFEPIGRGEAAQDPTIYVCAQDRGTGRTTPGLERFETIVNAAPLSETEEPAPCFDRTIPLLAERGLSFTPEPEQSARTGPQDWEALYPGSLGALYGRSPSGPRATFRRPTARTAMPGLYLAGGAAHPGPGVPMAVLSGRHAAEAIIADRTSTSMSRPTDTPGGTSTGSATTAPAPSRSSDS